MQIIQLFSLLYIAGCSYLQRGGSPVIFNPMLWLKSKNLPSLRPLYFVALIWLPFMLISYITSPYFIMLYVVGYILGGIKGWGSYFDMGSSIDNPPEIGWIDRILQRIFGTINAQSSYARRAARDYTGFYLRLNYFVGVFLLPLLYSAWRGKISLLSAFSISGICITAFAAITPLFYGIYFLPKFPRGKIFLPEFCAGALLMALSIIMIEFQR
jgi:hypothetical protein